MEGYSQKIKRKKSLYRRLADSRTVQRISAIALPVLLGIVIFALWQGGVLQALFRVDTFVLPVPTKIGELIRENWDAVISNSKATLAVTGLGLLFGSLAPVMNNWTRDVSTQADVRSMVSKTIVVLLIAAANMSLNAYRGLTELKPYSRDLMDTYAASKARIFFRLQLPNSVPYIFTALKVSVPASIMTAIVSEYFAENIIGVGRQIRENIVLAQYSIAWVYITAACVIGIASYVLLMLAQTLIMKRYH